MKVGKLELSFIAFLLIIIDCFGRTEVVIDGQVLRKEYSDWKLKFGMQYNNLEEDEYRFQIFSENYRKIQQHNANQTKAYTMGLNKFADLSPAEFREQYLHPMPPSNNSNFETQEMSNTKEENNFLPLLNKASDELDWSYLTGRVRNQIDEHIQKGRYTCNSCYAYSIAAAIYSSLRMHWIDVPISIQQLMDCCGEGCDRGNREFCFDYSIDHWIFSENLYPITYEKWTQNCKEDIIVGQKGISMFKVKRLVTVKPGQKQDLLNKLKNQPISVGIDASDWQFYQNGILDVRCDGTEINHSVLLVGYSERGWKLKNSWGPIWGENGYITIDDPYDDPDPCLITQRAYYPIMS